MKDKLYSLVSSLFSNVETVVYHIEIFMRAIHEYIPFLTFLFRYRHFISVSTLSNYYYLLHCHCHDLRLGQKSRKS